MMLTVYDPQNAVGGVGSNCAARHLNNRNVLQQFSVPMKFFYSFDISNGMAWNRLTPHLAATDLIIFNRPWPHQIFDLWSVRDMQVSTLKIMYSYLPHRTALAVMTLRSSDRELVQGFLGRDNWAPSNRTLRQFVQLYSSQRCGDQGPTNYPTDTAYAIVCAKSKDTIACLPEDFCLMERARATLLAGRNVLCLGCHTLEWEIAFLQYNSRDQLMR